MVDERDPLLLEAHYRPQKKRYGTPCTRFLSFVVLGSVFLIAFNFLFFPRTSLRRDLFRLHSVYLPDSEVERILFDSIKKSDLRKFAHDYTQTPHLAGEGLDLVDLTVGKFEEYGLDTKTVEYYTYLNYPLEHALKLVDPKNNTILYEATLEEDVLEQDETTGLSNRTPTFHGYSASGNVTAKFIYANYGRKEDFDALVEQGVEIKGKIVIVRYDRIFRGLKVKFAQEHGAVGVLIYTDPTGDGGVDFTNGYKAYPDGPARNPSAVQRGSVMYLSYAPGDPTTPGYPSKKGALRQDPKDSIPLIPSLPISYREVLPILKALNGKGPKASDLGDDWDGILSHKGVEYNIGPSDFELNLYNLQNYTTTPITNVIATYEGILKDEVIVVGNHRDAWLIGGAGDPNSGSAVLLSFAKALGKLKEKGWRPLRTIVLASWDGEEYALLGSTEWGEDNEHFLGKKAVAYVNLDVAVSGTRFSAGASPSLNKAIYNISQRVPHPEQTGKSLFDVWNERNGAHIQTLGTGSDFTVFLDHLGIPSVDFGFGPGGSDAVYHYHSNYDSFYWIDNFVNNSWAYHKAAAEFMGLLTITLSQHAVIDFHYEEYADVLTTGLDNILEQHKDVFDASEFVTESQDEDLVLLNNNDHNRNHNRDHHNDHDDHPHRKTPKTPKEAVAQLKHALAAFKHVSIRTDKYSKWLQHQFTADYPWYKYYKKFFVLIKIKRQNYKLKTLERLFLHEEGLDGRQWFKHIFFAPNRYLGYGGTTFPGILESLEDKDRRNFLKWAVVARDALFDAIDYLSGH